MLSWRAHLLAAFALASLLLAGMPLVLPRLDACCSVAQCCCAETLPSCCSQAGESDASPEEEGPRVASVCPCGHGAGFLKPGHVSSSPLPRAAGVAPPELHPGALARRAALSPRALAPEVEPPVPRLP